MRKTTFIVISAAVVCHPRFCSCTLDRGTHAVVILIYSRYQNMFFPELIFTVLYVKKFLVFKLNKYVNYHFVRVQIENKTGPDSVKYFEVSAPKSQ